MEFVTVATSRPRKFNLLAWFVMAYQRTKFSHTLIIDGNTVYHAVTKGVSVDKLDAFLEHSEIVTQHLFPKSKVDFNFILANVGKKYGWNQIFWLVLKVLFHICIPLTDKNSKFICSELVGKAIGMPNVDDLTTPKQVDEYLQNIC